MNGDPLRLIAVVALPDRRLRLSFEDGWSADVDLSGWIADTRALEPLSEAALFARARLGPFGTSVVWVEDTLDLGADNLRNLAVEQSGGIGHERLVTWMHDNQLTQACAAEAIGISRRMLNYYLSGARPIPKMAWLACLGWSASQQRRAA